MSEAKDQPGKTTTARGSGEAQATSDTSESRGEQGGAATGGEADRRRVSPAEELAEQLASGFREQVQRALGIELSDDFGATALAYVDHFLGSLRDETREPIVSLVAANAGAWFGELVRREIGGFWIGDGVDPRRLRLLLEPQFVHFSPVDMAYEAISSSAVEPGDPRIPEGTTLDSAYHLRKRSLAPFEHEPSDHDWVLDRLAESPPVPEDQFYSLTGRFETLELILELLAGREHERGREPTRYHLNDYVAALTDAQ